MPRKGPASRREIVADPIHKSVLVTQFVNKILQRGKRSTAERIMYNALDIVADTSGNLVVTRAMEAVKESVRQGSGIAKPLESQPVFPDMVVQMIAVGETTGSLDEMLGRIADFYDQEVSATTEQLTALIEPIMIVVLGAVVGSMIITMYLPIFNIFELIK